MKYLMATLNKMVARVGVGVCLDRINRIVRVRVESWSSRKEVGTIPTPTIFSNYLQIL